MSLYDGQKSIYPDTIHSCHLTKGFLKMVEVCQGYDKSSGTSHQKSMCHKQFLKLN